MGDLKRIVNTLRIHRPEYGAIMSSRDAKKAAAEIERLRERCRIQDKLISDNADLHDTIERLRNTDTYHMQEEIEQLRSALKALGAYPATLTALGDDDEQ